MKSLHKWGVVFWLVVLLCVPWSLAEAGRAVNLSDYLVFESIPNEYWILGKDGEDPYGETPIDALKITFAPETSGGGKFSYQTGKFNFSSGFTVPSDTITLFSYSITSGLFEFDSLVRITIDDEGNPQPILTPIVECESLDDRQPTGKLINLNYDSSGKPIYAMQLDLPRNDIGYHPCLQISFMDISTWDGRRRTIPLPFLELYVSIADMEPPGILGCTLGGVYYNYNYGAWYPY